MASRATFFGRKFELNSRKNCILFASNLAQIAYAEFVAWQIRQQGLTDIPILIASSDAQENDLKHGVAQILPINTKGLIAQLPQNARLSEYTYWRLPGIAAAARVFDRVLYLDTDLFIVGNDLLALFEMDLQGAPVAAVRDVHQSVRPHRVPNEFRALGLPNAPYFNGGLLLIDGRAFERDKVMEQIEFVAKAHSNALSAHDQSLLNIIFHGNWLEISPVWNWQFSYRNKILTPYIDMEVMHLAGSNKPWNDPFHRLPAAVRAEYARYTKKADTNFLLRSDDLKSLQLLKHIWYRNRYWDWLSRFPNKYDGILANAFND